MNYELAKQLKDAGFPQVMHYKGVGELDGYLERDVNIDDHLIATPTLSELIEACGEGFFAISHWEDGWQSEGGPVIQTGPADKETKKTYTAQIQIKSCHTPEEAVAKLWFTLQPK